MDKIRFTEACKKVSGGEQLKSGVGTLSEKTVHAVLKNYFEPFTDSQEQKICGFVADIAGENGIIEIQTKGFDKLRKKLDVFLTAAPVTIVHPVYSKLKIIKLDEKGTVISRRTSPKKESFYDIFPELYKIKNRLAEDNLTLHIVMLEAEEYRITGDVKKPRRSRKDYVKYDKYPTELADELILNRPADYLYFIPNELRSYEFTANDLADAAKISLPLARIALNILTSINVTEKIGARNRRYLYKVTTEIL